MFASNGIIPSVGKTGICFDNAAAESWNATFKKELIHLHAWTGIQHVRMAAFEFIEVYYNRKRIQRALGYLAPAEFEFRVDKECAKGIIVLSTKSVGVQTTADHVTCLTPQPRESPHRTSPPAQTSPPGYCLLESPHRSSAHGDCGDKPYACLVADRPRRRPRAGTAPARPRRPHDHDTVRENPG